MSKRFSGLAIAFLVLLISLSVFQVSVCAEEAEYDTADLLKLKDFISLIPEYTEQICFGTVSEYPSVAAMKGGIKCGGDNLRLYILDNTVYVLNTADGNIIFPESCAMMFEGCTAAKIIFGECVDTSHVRTMTYMFKDCVNLGYTETVDLTVFDTSSVTDMAMMFYGCYSMKTLDISSFDTSHVTNMNCMFAANNDIYGKMALTTVYASSSFTVSSIDEDLTENDMFDGCSNLVGGNGTKQKKQKVTGTAMAHIDGGKSNPGYFTTHPICGDVNNDGEVNAYDAVILAQYIAGRNANVNVNTADTDGDGKVTPRDSMVLTRYLAGWEGYTSLPSA